MTKTLTEMSKNSGLYETDFYAWTIEQAKFLKDSVLPASGTFPGQYSSPPTFHFYVYQLRLGGDLLAEAI